MGQINDIASVTLENEMDLILAHKRSMRLAELSGLSLSAQTTFATAVSEVSRIIIEGGRNGSLVLCVENEPREKNIIARLKAPNLSAEKVKKGLEYAKRLVNNYKVSTQDYETSIELYYYISPSFRIDILKLDEWRNHFRNEPLVSPYEELRRKNDQLQELSEKVKKSESQYRTLTNSLPLIIFSLDFSGQIIYANEWLSKLTGYSIERLNAGGWKNVVHEEDYELFNLHFKKGINKNTHSIKIQSRIKNSISGDYLWHEVSFTSFKNENDELENWIGYIVDIHKQKIFEETLKDNAELKQTQSELKEQQVAMETVIEELNRSNQELQQFAFIASHDLQEPVRKLLFYSDSLLGKYAPSFDSKGVEYLTIMHASALRMRILIHDLLTFSQINKSEINYRQIDLNELANTVKLDLEMLVTEKKAQIHINQLPSVDGDERMMRQLFTNILNNALKYSKAEVSPVIHITSKITGEYYELSFRDNGIGFEEQYLPQIFTLFQRLHSREIYEGTGLGLAICRKIVELHNGKIWAESKPSEGATFFIHLPI